MLALIVDDSRTMRMVLSRIVGPVGFNAVGADCGRAGLKRLRAMQALPDVMMVNGNMPDIDGLEFVSAVRSRPDWCDIPIIMVSAESEPAHIARALAAGVHEYVIKPFTPDAIGSKLRLLGLVGDAVGAAGRAKASVASANSVLLARGT
jgi:two-component system chemotaxis response regulator CheY